MTTLRMLAGQLRPKGVHVPFGGLDVAQHPKQMLAQIGICFERTNRYVGITAL